MIGRRAIIGLSLLSALLFSAFAAQNASAIERVTSNNTTAFTCVRDLANHGDFKDEHCDETGVPGQEGYKHELIPVGQTTAIDLTNEKVTEFTKKSEPKGLKGTIGLAKVEIECTTGKNNTATSWIRNSEPKAGQHTLEGTIETEMSNCNVKLLSKCIVKEPIVSKFTVHGVEGMVGPTGPAVEPNAMGLEFVGHGESETITEIEFKNKGAEACSLNGKKFPLKGSMVATNGPTTASDQSNKETGATLVFTPKTQTLTFGPNPAEFKSISTMTMAGGGNPIARTTTT
jgi:hypothetical protein